MVAFIYCLYVNKHVIKLHLIHHVLCPEVLLMVR